MAKYVYDHGICRKETLRIESGAGVKTLDLEICGGRVQRGVDMGRRSSRPQRSPRPCPAIPWSMPPWLPRQTTAGHLRLDGQSALHHLCRPLEHDWVLQIGRQVEVDPHFPKRVNAEFVELVSPSEVKMRLERGSGETLACGTGANAVCVAGVLSGRTQRKVLIHLPGGDLELHWADDNRVYMTGPAWKCSMVNGKIEPRCNPRRRWHDPMPLSSFSAILLC